MTLCFRSSRRYEQGHWDSVIKNYREVELFDEELDDLKYLLQPIRQFIEERHNNSSTDPTDHDSSLCFSGSWLPCHAIDLHHDGELNAHVDSVRFSGNLVAGLSLLSDAIMRLKPSRDSSSHDSSDEKGDVIPTSSTVESSEYIDLLLPRRSLYVLSGMSRYRYSHELLPSGSRFQNTVPIPRDRRLSVIFRDTKI
jgi:alkylated DNA repair protein alkB homolog 7